MPGTSVLLIYPMCAMVFLSVVVLLVMFRRRVNAVLTGQTKMVHYKTFSVGQVPEEAIQAARHFSNLFEIPVLFYAACIVGMILPVQGMTFVVLAWLFVAARVVHAFIHLSYNKVYHRMSAFFTSVILSVAMWVMILFTALSASAAS